MTSLNWLDAITGLEGLLGPPPLRSVALVGQQLALHTCVLDYSREERLVLAKWECDLQSVRAGKECD